MAKSTMTRAATLKCLEEKLRHTLDQLKTQENLNAQLLREREDSEMEMKQLLDRLSKMKSELKEQHIELLDTTDHRDTLQRLLEEGDQCRLVHNESLYEIEDLRRVLDQAQSKIISLEEELCKYKLDSTLNRYNEMLVCKNVHSHSCKFQSRKQSKKYLRLSRSMTKNCKLLKKYRVSVNTLRQSNLRLKDDLVCNNELLVNTIGSYEQEAQVFQKKILLLENQLEKISLDYSLAQTELSDHTIAMSQLVELCNENEQRFNSLLNNYSCNNCLDKQQNNHDELSINEKLSFSKSTPASSVIVCDGIGRGLGSIVNRFSKDIITNLCFPNMSYSELYLQIIKNYDIYNKRVVLMYGSSLNVDKVEIYNLFDWIGRIHSNKRPTQLTLVTFPYFRNVNNKSNALIYEKNCLMLHLSKSFDFVNVIDINSYINKSFMTRFFLTSFRYILAKLLTCNFNFVLPCKTNFININVSTITNNVLDKDFCPPLDVGNSICSQLGDDKDYCPPLINRDEDFCPQPRCVDRDLDISKVTSKYNLNL